ncbi:MAG: hypothetical protein HZC28_17945 [Spirochaetes bacterium]|nr:hypothetical protein [Spirochaetota bacterium]
MLNRQRLITLARLNRLRKQVQETVFQPVYIVFFGIIVLFSLWVTSIIYEPHITTLRWNNPFLIFFSLVLPLTSVLIGVSMLVQLFISVIKKEAGAMFRLQVTMLLLIAILTPTVLVAVVSMRVIRFNYQIWLTGNGEASLEKSVAVLRQEYDVWKEKTAKLLDDYNALLNADAAFVRAQAGEWARVNAAMNGRFSNETVMAVATNGAAVYPSGRDNIAALMLRSYHTMPAGRTFAAERAYGGRTYRFLLRRIDRGSAAVGYIAAVMEPPRDSVEKRNEIVGSLQFYKQLRTTRQDFEFIMNMLVIFGAAAVSVIVIFISFLMSRSITTPIMALARGTKKIAEDDLSFIVRPQGTKDVRNLMERFNMMVRSLRHNRELSAAHERMIAWRDVALRLAHEIKNPLTPINLNAELITRAVRRRKRGWQRQVGDAAAAILSQSNTILSLVRDFSQFSFVTELSSQPISVNSSVKSAFSSYKHASRRISMQLELSKRDFKAPLDSKKFASVLVNLMKNAVESIENTGTVTVRTSYRQDAMGECFTVSVADTGAGIPDHLLTRIFEPYYTTKEKGSGLGLSVVEKIVHDHHAVLRVDSVPGKGSVFSIDFRSVTSA